MDPYVILVLQGDLGNVGVGLQNLEDKVETERVQTRTDQASGAEQARAAQAREAGV